MTEDLLLDIQLPAAEALMAAGSQEESTAVRDRLRMVLTLLVPRILNEDIRVRWLRGPMGRELTRLAGPLITPERTAGLASRAGVPLAEGETMLLRLLTQGRTNSEIATDLGTTEQSVVRQLAELFAKIGASSRADATALALMGKLV